MIQNNLDPAVAERPQDLVVYGGRGQAARSWEAFDAILDSLNELEDDETLLVQSGKPVVDLQNPPRCAARFDCQLEPGPTLGYSRAFRRPGRQGLDHVWPNDGRVMDLYRHPGHLAGHL